MAHFYSHIEGKAKTRASRTGTKKSGLSATVASWEGAVRVTAWFNTKDKEDWIEVSLIPWHGAGIERTTSIYRGPISRFEPAVPSSLKDEWCGCSLSDIERVIYGDNECPCGCDNDHYHCHACGCIVQTG